VADAAAADAVAAAVAAANVSTSMPLFASTPDLYSVVVSANDFYHTPVDSEWLFVLSDIFVR
jgi:hypothetical protein